MKLSVFRAGRTVVLTGVAALILSGCTALSALLGAPDRPARQSHNSSSLVEFLYPGGRTPPRENQIPELRVPLRVGLAFLPTQNGAGPTAVQRDELLERIRQRFADRKFVTEIVTIPDYYLRTHRGFGGLQGVQRLYSVDVMALVSYDQITHMDENEWSFGYLTIVGAYVLKGSHHDVATLVDLAVIDPVTQSLILRAGGTDSRNRNTTLIDEERAARESGAASFGSATTQMIDNFDVALTKFEADVRAGKANIRVARREANARAGGGGSFGPLALGMLLIVLAARRRPRPCPDFPSGQSHTLLLPWGASSTPATADVSLHNAAASNRCSERLQTPWRLCGIGRSEAVRPMGKIMRIALTSALLLVAAMAFADEPSAPETSTEAAAQATSDKSAAQPVAAETTAKVAEDDSKVAEDNRPFKPPSGYRPKRINGELVYCSKKTILGSQFPVTDCRNEAQLREMVRTNRGMREDLNRNRACAGSSCSAR